MSKIATVNARMEPALKKRAEHILRQVGLSSAEAIRLFYSQVCLQKGLPFEVKLPNSTTLKAMHDADERHTFHADNIEDLFGEND